MVPGPADALHARRDRRRRLDLNHQIDGAHVDAQFHRRRGDDRRQLASLEPIFDLHALRPRDRSRGGLGRSLRRPASLIAAAQALRQPAAVDKDHRRAVAADQLHQSRMDCGPDRTQVAAPPTWRPTALSSGLPSARHVLDRRFDPQVKPLRLAGVDDLDRPRPRLHVGLGFASAPPSKAGNFLQRPLRGGESDALERRRLRVFVRAADCSSRSSVRNKCTPRLVAAIAWISSMMTVSTLARIVARLRL